MSRFVSGGTDDAPTERDEEWLKAQQEIEARHREKAEAGKQNDGKSLYETLQANKAAKQDAFEESIRLKNQFRSLDEDEVEFLDSVLESTRAKEAEVKKQTSHELNAFRKQQEEADRAAKIGLLSTSPETTADANDGRMSWSVSRKRKKGRDDDSLLGGVKLRKASSGDKTSLSSGGPPLRASASPSPPRPVASASTQGERGPAASPPYASQSRSGPADKSDQPEARATSKSTPPPPKATATSLGLVAYSSDEDD